MVSKACSDCEHWAKIDNAGLRGQCRFMPPSLPTSDRYGAQVFPETKSTDWCGAFALNHKLAQEYIEKMAQKLNLPSLPPKAGFEQGNPDKNWRKEDPIFLQKADPYESLAQFLFKK